MSLKITDNKFRLFSRSAQGVCGRCSGIFINDFEHVFAQEGWRIKHDFWHLTGLKDTLKAFDDFKNKQKKYMK